MQFPQTLPMTVRGKVRSVQILGQRPDGSFSARVRNLTSGSSIRGVVRQNRLGVLRFTATNPENLD